MAALISLLWAIIYNSFHVYAYDVSNIIMSYYFQVGIPFPEDRRRVSRQILTEMNVAQLQVIVNDLHTQIESEFSV
jgi:hypothetical protein